MKFDNILLGLSIIMLINSFCIYLVNALHLPIPSPLLGMIVLSVLLFSKLLNVEKIKDAGMLLLESMGMLFIPPAISIMLYFDIISQDLLPILLVIFIPYIIVMLVSGKVVDILLKNSTGGSEHE